MKQALLAILFSLMPLMTSADAVEINGIYYNLSTEGKVAEVTRRYYVGSVDIPVSVIYDGVEYSVTSIEKKAFYECSELISVTIPNSVISIGESAFQYCTRLTSINIPNSLTTISSTTFDGCRSLSSITIPNSVTSIGSGAFQGCSGLTSVTIPSSVAIIGGGAFAGCSGLTNIIIPNSITSIESRTFQDCSGLTSITIPNSITSIGEFAFSGCSSLSSITIPSSITSIGSYAFEKSGLISVDIPNSITSIKSNTFADCNRMKSLTIPNSVTSIEKYAFSWCSSLESITIGTGVRSIGNGAFNACESLNAVHISDIEAWMNISFLDGSSGAFPDENSPSNPLEYAHHLYLNGQELTDLIVPETLNVIKSRAFKGCVSLINVTIPNTVKYIYEEAFKGCSNLTNVDIPNSVTAIYPNAFYNCSSLTSITIPNSRITINGYAFWGCSELKSITIGNVENSIPWIKGGAFGNCKGLKDVTCYTEMVPDTYENAFQDTNIEYATLHIPSGSLEAYNSREPWKNFGTIVEMEKPKYQLTYIVDGTEYKSYQVEVGATIVPEPAPTKEGYTFSGWSEIPEEMPANDVTVTGSFTINKYKLTYKVDGEVYKESEVEYGVVIIAEAAPTKEGYTFSGWSEIPKTMPANDVTITGTFTVNKYKLIYKVDGSEYKSYEVDYGSNITAEAAPTKEGYTFSGWSEIPKTMPAKDVTITGTFTINKYKLIYKVDGSEYKTYEIEYGSSIVAESEPTKEGYTFSGWSEIPQTMPANDVTVTGTFTVNSYKLIYMVDGEVYKSYDVKYGTSITSEAEPTKEGYTFSGWSEIPTIMPANDVIVTGTFSINRYKLTYMVDGEEYESYIVEYGAYITPEVEPTKVGYTFSGWSKIPTTMPAYDVTITGTFIANNYKLTYMVDGEEYESYNVEYGARIIPEAEPTKEGYTFSGWSEIPVTMPAYDVTITGTFSINSYKLTYMVDGEEYESYIVEYGARIIPEAEPTKEGYTFSGWSEIPATMPAYDVIVTGSFSKGEYKLIYMVDGEVYKTISYDYDATITPEAEPTKEGYTFSGWSEIPETMPAYDVTVIGTFSINSYKLIYIVDGEEYKSYEKEYGASITPEAEPTKEGYTFSGWSEVPETMPAHDVEITGTFTQVVYEIDDVTYEITGDETVTINGGDKKGDVTIETTITINGQTYQVTAIADNAFKDNQNITSLTISEGITTIGDNAFSGCINLFVINIGVNVLSIGNKAFANVGSVSAYTRNDEAPFVVNCYAESVPQTASDAFENTPIETGTLFVVDEIKDSYMTTSPWNGFGKILGFEEAAGINAIMIDSGSALIFDMQGNRLDNVRKGVNIIRTKDGKTKKMMVK